MRTVFKSGATARRNAMGLVLLCGTLLAIIPASASAFTSAPVWNCRASALYASIAGNNRVEPLVANGNSSTSGNKSADRAQCASEEAGADSLATPLGIPDSVVGAQTASAKTTIEPELGQAIDQKVTSVSRVENLKLPLGGTTVLIGVGAANSTATGVCENGQAKLEGTSSMADLTLGGVPISLNGLLGGLQQVLQPLGVLVDVKFNEQVRENGSLFVRAAHIKVLRGDGTSAPLADIVIAESKVTGDASTCDPNGQIPGLTGKICPTGSNYDSMSGFCIIPAVVGGSGIIVVGRPFQGPSGGTVIGLAEAIKKYGRQPCLVTSSGPKYAVVGTNKADRITGTNTADRILGLGGNDSLDGGRANDCMEGNNGNDTFNGGIGDDRLLGGLGNDTMTGGLGKDNMDGGAGNDKVNGGSGADRMVGGTGADILNAGFGADRVTAGSGNDIVNVAVQGPTATVDCGSGRDKIRLNQNEKRKIRSCEISYVLADNKIQR
ncbi:calcium-binding protein [Paraconexibacter sp. AEG42_29]|uniref:calcium-binding protein n=1 Tax=Paraconexibacter sp. AEG42_29 TaxID=2997339 RepID=UPI00339D5A4B